MASSIRGRVHTDKKNQEKSAWLEDFHFVDFVPHSDLIKPVFPIVLSTRRLIGKKYTLSKLIQQINWLKDLEMWQFGGKSCWWKVGLEPNPEAERKLCKSGSKLCKSARKMFATGELWFILQRLADHWLNALMSLWMFTPTQDVSNLSKEGCYNQIPPVL